MAKVMSYEGSNCFRQRIILSCLSSLPVCLTRIRIDDEEPGLKDSEMSLLKLIEIISNGSAIEVDETGTQMRFTPGILIGGKVDFDCGLDRSIGYYLEVLACLAPFFKNALFITLKGITNDSMDPSIDHFKHATVPVLTKFLKCDKIDIEVKIATRGMRPKGGGLVTFKCPIRRTLKPIQLTDQGKVKRVRGVAYACRVSPQNTNRMVDTAKGLLLNLLPDVYIHTEHLPGHRSGLSPGFGLFLWAETTSGVVYCSEAVSSSGGDTPSVPEDVAKKATERLFDEIHRGGCTDSSCQGISLLFMALGDTDLSKVTFGPFSPYSIQLLRHMKDYLSITFKLDSIKERKIHAKSCNIQATCVGIGFSNLSKSIF